jgi:hypothetical protein
MKDRILKNNAEFLRWRNDCTAPCDTVSQPYKFPCVASMYVSNWERGEETAQYLYIDDLEEIIKEMRAL